jgi:hypothetical protein
MQNAYAAPFATARPATMPSPSVAAGLLAATGATPLVLWGLSWLGVGIPYGGWLTPALAVVSIIVFLVWIHGAFVALRGRTSFSPGMAVGGWFIPIANFVIPALVLRDGWRAAVGKGGGIAFLWMIAWWLETTLGIIRGAGVQFSSSDRGPIHVGLPEHGSMFEIPGLSMETFSLLYNLLDVGAGLAAYGLLALIVVRIGRG